MSFIVLIPARLASSRLPRKPLADIAGRPMVVRVADQARLSLAARVVVAADADEILAACAAHGVEAVATRSDHVSGSDRLAEAATVLGLADDAVVVNVQGDEPLISPTLINACAATLAERSDCVMSTVGHPIDDPAEYANPNVVKLVTDRRDTALYFSRATIPFWRDAPGGAAGTVPEPHSAGVAAYRHVGLYAYRVGFLKRFPLLDVSPLERVEALEQLRVLWHGERIAVHLTTQRPGPGVDTRADLERVRALFASGGH
jgi:3-deoxy-manno-octulosonate cytidylyltransferase (CMP-KDO synthetase)